MIPGWDVANDLNSDGYVDDEEFEQLVNPNATARMRYESRALPLGQMWNQRSCQCRINVWNAYLKSFISEWFASQWSVSGQRGAYNDDLMKLVGPTEFTITVGGWIEEYPSAKINSQDIITPFRIGFASILAAIGSRTNSKYIGGNISGDNLFASNSTAALVNALQFFLRESYITAGIGLTGYFGIQKMWDTFVYTAMGKKSLIQGMLWNGAVQLLDRTLQSSWERDISTVLAVYYLINTPNATSFQAWGNGWNYGSSNTWSYNFYKTGVPMNIAYQPTAMMEIDIGTPITSRTAMSTDILHKDYMRYQTKTTTPSNSYTVIGDTTHENLTHPELSPTGSLPTIPSFIYFLQRSTFHPQIPYTPLECVLAREYTKGIVLYRTDVYGASTSFLKTSITVNLPTNGIYRRLYFNGTLGPPAFNVTVRGYEGIIFVKDDPIPSTNIPTLRPTIQPIIPLKIDTTKFKLIWWYNFTSAISTISTVSRDFNIYQGTFSSSSNCYFLKSNAAIQNNQLTLTINNSTNPQHRAFSSAGIGSWGSHAQTYGRWEVQAKFPTGYGVTGYMGLFPTNKQWPPEVDFAEVIGKNPTKLFLTQHYTTNNSTLHKQSGSAYSTSTVDWTTSYHIYAIEWEAEFLRYYIDNTLVLNQTVQFPPLLMDIAIGTGTGDCGAYSWVDCPSNALAKGFAYPLPATMYINYIKQYSLLSTPTPSCAPSTRTPTSTPSNIPSESPTSSPTTYIPSTCTTTNTPTNIPKTNIPSSINKPSSIPTKTPSYKPSLKPSLYPSLKPSLNPSQKPSLKPSLNPSLAPTRSTLRPSLAPSSRPSYTPSSRPSSRPTLSPSAIPTRSPYYSPKPTTSIPTPKPSSRPSQPPSRTPSRVPSCSLSRVPSCSPSRVPSCSPSRVPSCAPLLPTRRPSSAGPSKRPSVVPTQPLAL